MPTVPLTNRPAWKALRDHHATIRDVHLRQLFTDDPRRGERLTVEAVGLYLDSELEELHGDQRAYDRSRRPRHMVDAIHALQDAGVEPDVWKVEGLDRTEDCAAVVAAARRAGRAGVGCIVLGRGEDEAKVESWLSTAAGVPGFIGFAVGRTTFWDALVGWRDGRTTREAAIAEVARRYTRWCQLFVVDRDALVVALERQVDPLLERLHLGL